MRVNSYHLFRFLESRSSLEHNGGSKYTCTGERRNSRKKKKLRMRVDERQTKNEVKEKKKLGRGKGFRIHGLGKRNWEGAGGKDHIRRRIGDDVA